MANRSKKGRRKREPTEKGDKRPTNADAGQRTLEGWRANCIELKLGVEHLDLLDNVTAIAPVLRIVTAIGQEARRRGDRKSVV